MTLRWAVQATGTAKTLLWVIVMLQLVIIGLQLALRFRPIDVHIPLEELEKVVGAIDG